jgi:hypothetical protein
MEPAVNNDESAIPFSEDYTNLLLDRQTSPVISPPIRPVYQSYCETELQSQHSSDSEEEAEVIRRRDHCRNVVNNMIIFLRLSSEVLMKKVNPCEPYQTRWWDFAQMIIFHIEPEAQEITYVKVREGNAAKHFFVGTTEENLRCLAKATDQLIEQRYMVKDCGIAQASLDRLDAGLIQFVRLLYNSYGNGENLTMIRRYSTEWKHLPTHLIQAAKVDALSQEDTQAALRSIAPWATGRIYHTLGVNAAEVEMSGPVQEEEEPLLIEPQAATHGETMYDRHSRSFTHRPTTSATSQESQSNRSRSRSRDRDQGNDRTARRLYDEGLFGRDDRGPSHREGRRLDDFRRNLREDDRRGRRSLGLTSNQYPREDGAESSLSGGSLYDIPRGTSGGAGPGSHTLAINVPLPEASGWCLPKGEWRSNWKLIITYLQQTLSNRVAMRINQWPERTLEAICQVWKTCAPSQYRSGPKEGWKRLPNKELLAWFEDQYKDSKVNHDLQSSIEGLNKKILDYPFIIDFMDEANTVQTNSVMQTYLELKSALNKQNKDYPNSLTKQAEKNICSIILKSMVIKGLQKGAKQSHLAMIRQAAMEAGDTSSSPHSVDKLLDAINDNTTGMLSQIQGTRETFILSGSSREKEDKGKGKDKKAGDTSSAKPPKPNREKPKEPKAITKKKICRKCGYGLPKSGAGCTREGCSSDPRRNQEMGVEWIHSKVGKLWKAQGYDTFPKDKSITLSNAVPRNKQGIYLYSTHSDNILSPELIPFSVVSQDNCGSKGGATVPPPVGKLLLDTGALGSNVMSNDYFKRIRSCQGSYIEAAARHSIITPGKNKLTSNKTVTFKIELANERKQSGRTSMTITAAVAPIDIDLILDKKTVKKHSIVQLFPSHFAEGELLERIAMLPLATEVSHESAMSPHLETDAGQYATLDTINVNPVKDSWVHMFQTVDRETTQSFYRDEVAARVDWNDTILNRRESNLSSQLHGLSARPSVKQKKNKSKTKRRRPDKPPLLNKKELKKLNSLFLGAMRLEQRASNLSCKSPYEREGKLALDEIPDHKLESVPTELLKLEEELDAYLKVNVKGSPELLAKLRALVKEFKDIFKTTVQRTPSSAFEPFELEVDDSLWKVSSNSTPPRTMGLQRELELDRMIAIMLERDLIEDCSDAYYSHAFLTPKSNGSWRMVLDFKGLNRATTSKYAWPIPNIKDMLIRVGNSRPAYFAVFDLTSGYYQAPIAEGSRKYTAFKTRKGVYRWKRLPMGLTDAGSFFQHQLTANVLNGLINRTCELYLDDCMVYAKDEVEYMERLRQVFLRFREHKITLNPSKCNLGLTQVEYVGHTINKDGLHFTRDKLDSVMNFPRPETKKQIKSFLGLANYFRDHINGHSTRVQPLQNLVEGYSKKLARDKIVWTSSCEAAFLDIRQAIDECPVLWFVDDHSPIFLKTDASEYGIGAYLYQTVTDEHGIEKEHPIGFISKSLVSGHDSWDIPMKEGFAIFYALRKWEYLLRDRQFTVLTDHENLTRLRTERSANKMVTRWFMSYQEYDILAWVHVPGVDNEVPDSFSRLCANECKGYSDTAGEEATAMLFQLSGYEMDPKHWDIIRTKAHGHLSDRGHGGVKRTLGILDELNIDWPGRAKDVRKYIKMCPCCQKMNVMKPVIHSYPFTLSSYGLFHTVSVDLIEQLQEDEFGMKMVVVIIDNFSRFIDLYPIKDTGAEAVADALIQYTGRYKTPLRFTTDCGSNFGSNLVKDLVTRLGADHHLTKAYSKEQNAIVERVNREIISHLKAIIFDRRVHSQWSKYLPIVQRYVNTSVHSATGCTPAEIVFPDGAEIDRELLVNTKGVVVSAYVKDMQEAQGRIIAIAEDRLRKKDEAHMRSHEGTEPLHKAGDYVLAEHRHNSLRLGPKSKMLPYLHGPLLVVNRLPEGMYALRDLITMRLKDYHESKIQPFLYDERTLLPAQVAATDSFDEFVIEKVIKMRGNPRKKKSELSFLVRWAGYTEADDTWVSWKDGRSNTAVQLFLYEHPTERIRKLCTEGFDPKKLHEEVDYEENSDNEAEVDSRTTVQPPPKKKRKTT